MPTLSALFVALLAAAAAPASPADPGYANLRLYQGTWKVTMANGKTDTLVNQCSQLGKYFACAQTVNGESAALVVFIPAGDKPGHFRVQNIMPQGRATGITDLQISGDEWTYSNRRDENGQTTFFRTTNKFTGKNHIHFDQATSPDQKNWKSDNSGDEERLK